MPPAFAPLLRFDYFDTPPRYFASASIISSLMPRLFSAPLPHAAAAGLRC
jgi:hypothetical protein